MCSPMVVGIVGTLALVVLVAVLIKQSVREGLGGWIAAKRWRVWLLPAAILGFYSLLALSSGTWQREMFEKLAFYFGAPTLLLFCRGPKSQKGTPWDLALDLLFILLLWLPMEFRWVLKGWWTTIIEFEGKPRGFGYPINMMAAVAYILVVYGGYRKVDLKCDWSLTWPDFRLAMKMFFVLFIVLAPIGLTIGFLNPLNINSRVANYWWAIPIVLSSFFFAPGFAEELVSRGGMQNLFASWFGTVKGILLTAAIFGFSHINNAVKPNFPTPNWTYVGFATFAGLIYGYLYWRRSRDGAKGALVIGAILHAFVDFTWLLFFKG